ncbi:MAG TPA: class I SAM-dependent methyltransferase [Alphaproteobacteria bacterium]|nr:class I SAM-dependent methyltransferase [Alphaproteobacteria bacterium]
MWSGDGRVRSQYEAYPYPARDPRDEKKRLITGSPSHLDELRHHLFAGRLDPDRPFRVLVAGGGTGDGLIMLAQQCRDAGLAAEITYVDLSEASRRLAEARAQVRGLTDMIAFRTGSLLELDRIAPGPFDYIDCCGVLHHLDDPAAGLAALAARLAPGGGMGLMVYGALGRTGVYPLQSALRRLTDGLPDAERVALAKRLLGGLPETNWFQRNPGLGDHKASDAGLYDLLLHSRDRAYTVPEVADLVAECGLGIVTFIDPLLYDPALLIADPGVRGRIHGLDPLARAALAEELSGAIKTHIFYVKRRDEAAGAQASPDDATLKPVLRGVDAAALARTLKPGKPLAITRNGLRYVLEMPPLAGAIAARIDGERTIGDLHRDVAATQPAGLSRDVFRRQFDALYAGLNGFSKLFLRG